MRKNVSYPEQSLFILLNVTSAIQTLFKLHDIITVYTYLDIKRESSCHGTKTFNDPNDRRSVSVHRPLTICLIDRR